MMSLDLKKPDSWPGWWARCERCNKPADCQNDDREWVCADCMFDEAEAVDIRARLHVEGDNRNE